MDNLITLIRGIPDNLTYTFFGSAQLTNDLFPEFTNIVCKGIVTRIGNDVADLLVMHGAKGYIASGRLNMYTKEFDSYEIALKSDLSEKLSIYSKYEAENAPFSLQLTAGQYLVFVYSMNYSAPVAVKMFLLGGGDYNDGIDHYKAVQIFSNSESITLSGTVSSDNSKMLTLTASGQPNMFIKAIKIH